MSTMSPSVPVPAAFTQQVSLVYLYLLRAVYLIIGVGLALTIWPQWMHPPSTLAWGVVRSMLTAFSLMSLLGIRYPLKMLPVLFWELAWKSIWLIAVALPLWLAHRVDADTADTIQACLMVVIVPIAMPWRYVFANYIVQRGDRWK